VLWKVVLRHHTSAIVATKKEDREIDMYRLWYGYLVIDLRGGRFLEDTQNGRENFFSCFIFHFYSWISPQSESQISLHPLLVMMAWKMEHTYYRRRRLSQLWLTAHSQLLAAVRHIPAPVNDIVLTMERLFSPCTGDHDYCILLNVSIEELLSADRAFTYADLYAMLGDGDTLVWLTPHAFIARKGSSRSYSSTFCFTFNADTKGIVAFSRSPEHLLEICDVVVRLLAASVVHSVHLNWNDIAVGLINAPTLAYLLEQCQSLETLTLIDQTLDENHCRALGDYSRPGLEIVLRRCKLTNAGTSALAEVLGRNQGPTKLDYCHTDYSVLADGLRGNSRLKFLKPHFSEILEVSKREVLAIAGALKENKGLVELELSTGCFTENDETWGAICDSLKTHPTLEILNLRSAVTDATRAPKVITSRIQALLGMMKINLSTHTIRLFDLYSKHELFQGSVIPYLETNRLRPRLLAIQKTRPISYRAKVLGRALLAARSDANSLWILLLGNAEVAFPSTAATTTLAATLPTSATAAATSTEIVAVITAAPATSALTPSTDSASGVSDSTVAVAANDAIPAAGQKRKARL
jgi:hypothetical protein